MYFNNGIHLRSKNQIKLTDPISHYLPNNMIDGLHVLNEVDYSKEITVGQFLSNTSGLPDYLSVKRTNGRTADSELNQGKDELWTLNKIVMLAK